MNITKLLSAFRNKDAFRERLINDVSAINLSFVEKYFPSATEENKKTIIIMISDLESNLAVHILDILGLDED